MTVPEEIRRGVSEVFGLLMNEIQMCPSLPILPGRPRSSLPIVSPALPPVTPLVVPGECLAAYPCPGPPRTSEAGIQNSRNFQKTANSCQHPGN